MKIPFLKESARVDIMGKARPGVLVGVCRGVGKVCVCLDVGRVFV